MPNDTNELDKIFGTEKDVATEEWIEQAIVQLHQCCDGARTQDEIGFAGFHTRTGKNIGAKLMRGEKLTVLDVQWAEKALPYYLNTQLGWLKDDFNDAIKDAQEKAYERFSAEQKEKNDLDKWLLELEYDELLRLFNALILEKIGPWNRDFIKSLQKQNKAGKLMTPKQLYWIRRFTAEYWHLVKHLKRDATDENSSTN